jgi:hypothetical protein
MQGQHCSSYLPCLPHPAVSRFVRTILLTLLFAAAWCVQVCFFAHTLEEIRTVEPEDLPVLLEDGAAGALAGQLFTCNVQQVLAVLLLHVVAAAIADMQLGAFDCVLATLFLQVCCPCCCACVCVCRCRGHY